MEAKARIPTITAIRHTKRNKMHMDCKRRNKIVSTHRHYHCQHGKLQSIHQKVPRPNKWVQHGCIMRSTHKNQSYFFTVSNEHLKIKKNVLKLQKIKYLVIKLTKYVLNLLLKTLKHWWNKEECELVEGYTICAEWKPQYFRILIFPMF